AVEIAEREAVEAGQLVGDRRAREAAVAGARVNVDPRREPGAGQHQVGAAVGVQIGELQIGEREHLGGDRRREREGAARLAVAVARLSISITRLAVAITRLSIAIARLALGARRTALVGRY